MIVYNVKRRWFVLLQQAEMYRRTEGLKPGATAKITVTNREELAALLNALCEPNTGTIKAVEPLVDQVTAVELVDRAFVDPNIDVPDYVPLFLISDPKQREEARLRLMEKRE